MEPGLSSARSSRDAIVLTDSAVRIVAHGSDTRFFLFFIAEKAEFPAQWIFIAVKIVRLLPMHHGVKQSAFAAVKKFKFH
jgi:hypothetical protein